jgi:RNA polymerase sigma-70 factor (ECF subfamily)
MVAFQGGNASAFDLLFQRYRSPLFSFILRMLGGDRAGAEDLLQDVFLRIVRSRDLYDPGRTFSTWLFAIARNHCINYLRSKGYRDARATVSLDGSADPDSVCRVPEPAVDAPPAGPMQGRELVELVDAAVRRLPVAYREVFLLRAVEGFSHAETANVLRLSEGNVRVLYLRARQMLRNELSSHGWEGV